ncbi:hypothetical protein [Capnocytophaga bilenii]
MIDDYFLMSSALGRCVLSFGASRTGFTYSAVPARRLSFGASRTGFYPSSHTRLRQLADFPSLILR